MQDQEARSRRVVQLRPGELDFFQFAKNLTLKVADGYSVAGLVRVQADLAVDLPPSDPLWGAAGKRNGSRLSVSIAGFFIRPQFCHYFNTDRKQALRVVRALVARRAGIEGDSMMFPGGARLCRISNMAIYRALGVENIRHRRKARNSVLMRRLLSLDFVLEHPGLNWLPTEPEKVEFFEGLGISSRLVPRRIYYGDDGAKNRYFTLKLPIAGGAETVTFGYVDPGRESTGELNGSRACSALGCDPRQGATGPSGCHCRRT